MIQKKQLFTNVPKRLMAVLITSIFATMEIHSSPLQKPIKNRPADWLSAMRDQQGKILYYLKNNVDSAQKQIEVQKRMATINHNPQWLIQSYINMSELKILKGDFQSAKNYAKAALKILTTRNQEIMTAKGLIVLGLAEDKLSNTVKATHLLHNALRIANKLSVPEIQDDVNLALGVVSGNGKNYLKALSYFNKSLEISKQNKEEGNRIFALYGIGVTYSMKGEIKTGMKYLKRALNLCEDGGNDILKTKILLNLAKSQIELDNKSLALRYYEQTRQFAKSNGMKDQLAMSVLGIAVSLDDPLKSPDYFQQAQKLANLTGNKLISLGILQNLAAFYKMHGPLNKAINYTEQYHILKDSIYTVKKSTQIAELEAVNELQSSKAKFHNMEINLLKSKQEKTFNTSVSIFLSCIICIIGFGMHRQRKLILKINHEKEKAAKLIAMNEYILKILEHDLVGPMSALNAMLHLLRQNKLSTEEQHTLISQLALAQQQTIDTLDKVLKWGNQRSSIKDIQKMSIDPFERISGIIELLQPMAMNYNVEIIHSLSRDKQLFADPTHFDFIMRNIIHNAIKFCIPGSMVKVGLLETTKEKLTFFVRNDGVSLTQQELETILTGSAIPKRSPTGEHGTGLGLKLSQELLKANGGMLYIITSNTPGTTFGISFDLNDNQLCT